MFSVHCQECTHPHFFVCQACWWQVIFSTRVLLSHRQTPIHPSRPRLSGLCYLKTSADFPWGVFFLSLVYRVEKAMAPHSGALAWKIPWTEETGGLQSMGSLRVRHNWSDWAAAATSSPSYLQYSEVCKDRIWSHKVSILNSCSAIQLLNFIE